MSSVRRSVRARLRDERGVAALELAIVIQFLFIILYGIVTYGFIFALDHNLNQAAAEGARATISLPDSTSDAAIAAYATNEARSKIYFNAAVTYATVNSSVAPCAAPADPTVKCVTVTVSYDYKSRPIVPAVIGFSSLVPDSVTAIATVELR